MQKQPPPSSTPASSPHKGGTAAPPPPTPPRSPVTYRARPPGPASQPPPLPRRTPAADAVFLTNAERVVLLSCVDTEDLQTQSVAGVTPCTLFPSAAAVSTRGSFTGGADVMTRGRIAGSRFAVFVSLLGVHMLVRPELGGGGRCPGLGVMGVEVGAACAGAS